MAAINQKRREGSDGGLNGLLVTGRQAAGNLLLGKVVELRHLFSSEFAVTGR